jgi:hypothetical protein
MEGGLTHDSGLSTDLKRSKPMKFLCLIYLDEDERDAIPADEWETLMRESVAISDELRNRGVSSGGNALQPVRTAVTLRRKRGERSWTDGPFAETKEQLAGYILIEAPDLEAAQEIALSLPPGRYGSVEIRPVWEREDLAARRVTAAERSNEYSARP